MPPIGREPQNTPPYVFCSNARQFGESLTQVRHGPHQWHNHTVLQRRERRGDEGALERGGEMSWEEAAHQHPGSSLWALKPSLECSRQSYSESGTETHTASATARMA